MFEVYLDEAGYTGSDLLNREQPVYTLAAITLPNDVAQDLVAQCFPRVKAKELKHSALSFRRRGRQQILDFIQRLAEHPNGASVTGAHKEYVLLGLLVDYWVEPALRLDGIDFYERGANIGFVNVTYLTLGALLGIDGRREFLRRFQVMVRDRTVFAYDSFWRSVRELRQKHPRFDEDLFGIYEAANRRLGGVRHLWDLPEHILDLGDYGLLVTVNHWREQTNEPLLLVHDKAKALVRNEQLWDAWLSREAPLAVVGQDRRVMRFPLDATIELADSVSHLQLQLADLVAGATATLMGTASGRPPKHPDYVEALRTGPLLQHCLIGGVWPTDSITPEDLETDGPSLGDAAEYMATLVAQARRDKRDG